MCVVTQFPKMMAEEFNAQGIAKRRVCWDIVVPDEFQNMDPQDTEGRRRWDYEQWELSQPSRALPERDWKELARLAGRKVVIQNIKKPKEETTTEKWTRIQEEREEKENKKVVRSAKKMKREGKIRTIESYFKK